MARAGKPRGGSAGKAPRAATAVYEYVLNTCAIRQWQVGLFYKGGRWTTEVHDRGELIAKSSTGHAAPQAFQIMGQKLKTSFERSKLLGD